MITRFDHAVVAVQDIPAALEAYRALGFDVAAGGRHPSLGTQNAIIRFGLDYIELLAVEDKAQARSRGPFGAELADILENSNGLVGFVLASSNLDEEAAGLVRVDQDAEGPFAMDRERPDGRRLAWRLVIPGGSPWRKPWPFLIEWETPDAERVKWDAPGDHANGAAGVAGIDLLVADIAAARIVYESAFGLRPAAIESSRVSYVLGGFRLSVGTPWNDEAARELAELGPGPFRLALRHRDAKADVIELPVDAALGARISLGASAI